MSSLGNNYSAKVRLIVGQRRCGKSHYCQGQAIDYLKRGGRVFYVSPAWFPELSQLSDKNNNFGFFRPPTIKSYVELLHDDRLRDGMLILDDVRAYINQNNTDVLRSLIINTRDKRLHLLIAYHSFSNVHSFCYELADEVIYFRTKDNLQRLRDKLPTGFPMEIIEQAANLDIFAFEKYEL